LNGWKTTTASYLANVALCEEAIQKNSNYSLKASLFALHTENKSLSIKKIKSNGIHNIMWDVLSADFDANVSQEQCLKTYCQI
jgi:hypothetical protein